MKALIIDDEIDICHLLCWLLKQKNVSSTCVNHLLDAQNQLTFYKPDIIFLDNHLPDGLGIDFIKTIKSNCPASKIVMITAHDTTIDKQIAVERGVDIFIGKPFTKECIYNVIEAIERTRCIPQV